MKLGEKCDACGLTCTKEEVTADGSYVDPCLGILPGVLFACCGHNETEGYILFENGLTIRFEELTTVEVFIINKHLPLKNQFRNKTPRKAR